MKKEEALKFIESNPEAELVIRTADDEATFLANFKEAEVEKEIKSHIGNLHQQYEKDFEPILGKKPDGVKTYNWIKEEGTKLKSAAEKLTTAETKLGELETKLKEGKGDDALVKRIEELQGETKRLEKLHKTAKEEWEQSRVKERTESLNLRKRSDLTNAMMGLKFLPKEIIDEDVRKTYVDKVLGELITIADYDESGKLVFKDTENQLMRNKDMVVVTPNELLSDRLKKILDNGRQQPGLGTDDTGKGKSDLHTDVVVPPTVSTITELTTYLRANYPNMKPQSKEYQVAFAKYSKDLKQA